MSDNLYWNTVTPFFKTALTKIMVDGPFQTFRLVGGTSLSLQLGHRQSVDLDLFTDLEYETADFKSIDNFLRHSFTDVSDLASGETGLAKSYIIGDNKNDSVKLDIYYTDPFIHPELIIGPYRLATVEEIIAMKIEVVHRGARKKDFWDLHELLNRYSISQMIDLHKKRYPYSHDESRIRTNLADFSNVNDDFEPLCLKGKYWELIKLDIIQALA